jgi:transcription antitermination protein NusB
MTADQTLTKPNSAKSRGKIAANGAIKPSAKSPRSRAREFALQGLYQFLVGKNDAASIDSFTRALSGFEKCDSLHFDALVRGCIEQNQDLDHALEPCIDRPWSGISPVEHSILWIGAYEFLHCKDVPWRVVLNECIELAKAFGGTDGHKWVNGVLNKLAPTLRAEEVARDVKRKA